MDALSILALGVAQAGGGGGGGTSDYSDLSNKPQINNVTLSGNKSLSDLGIQGEIEGNSISPSQIEMTGLNSFVDITPDNGISVASGAPGMPNKGIFISPGMNTIDIIDEDRSQQGMMPMASLGVSQNSELTVNGSAVAMKSDITTVNNARLTIRRNGVAVRSFTANDSVDRSADILVPENTSDLTNDSGFITLSDVPKELPTISTGDAGKVLTVNSGETGVEWATGGGGGGSIDGINELTVSRGTSNIGIGIGDNSLGNVLNGTGYIDSNVIQTSGDVLGSNKQVNINVGTDTFWANAAIGSRLDNSEGGTNGLVWKSKSTVANAVIASRLCGGNSNQEALQTAFANQNLIHGYFYGRYAGYVGGDNNTCFGGSDTSAQYESSTSDVNAPYYNFGNYNNVMGYQLQNKTSYATVIGKNNVLNTDKAFVIGNGSDNSNRSNALTVDWSGNLVCNNIPACPSADGTYNLQVSIVNGVPTYS